MFAVGLILACDFGEVLYVALLLHLRVVAESNSRVRI
jgi:hypothetical protein